MIDDDVDPPPPLITTTDIVVDEEGIWSFKGTPMRNEGALEYFKAHLARDRDGFYIVNRFGPRTEYARLQEVRGFPVSVTSLEVKSDGLSLSLDSGETRHLLPEVLYSVDEYTLIVTIDEIPIRFSGRAMAMFMPYLEKKGGTYRIVLPGGREIEIHSTTRNALLG